MFWFTFAAMFSAAIAAPARERWITGVFFFLSGLVTATWSSRIPDVQQHLQLNDAQWGRVLFALPAGLICGLPVSSWMVARFGARTILITSGVLFSSMLVLLGVSVNSWQLVIALFLFGFLRNLFNIAANTSAVEVQKSYDRPIISTFHGLWSVACFVAAGISTLLIAQDIGTGLHFLLIASLSIALCLLYKGKRQPFDKRIAEKRPLFVKPDKYLFLLGAIAFCSMLCEGTMFDWSVNYFDKIVAVNKSSVTVGYTCFIIAMAIGRLSGDRVVAHFGATRVLFTNAILMAFGLCLTIFLPFLLPAAIGFLLVGLGNSIMVPQLYSLASKSKKMKPTYAIASVTLIGYAGFMSGPLLVGYISEALGMQWAFGMVAMLCIVICFLILRVKKLYKK